MTPVSPNGIPTTNRVSQSFEHLDRARRIAAVAGTIFLLINTQMAAALYLVATALHFAIQQTEVIVSALLDTIDTHKQKIADQAVAILDLNRENEKLSAGNAKLAARIQEINNDYQHRVLNSAVWANIL